MPNINISVKNKIAEVTDKSPFIVCGNSDYTITFDLDEEWDEYIVRTARFIYNGNYTDVALIRNEVIVPVIQKAAFVSVGLFAGDITTTTPAVIPCIKSITSETGTEITEPDPNLYEQLLTKIDDIRKELIDSGGSGKGGTTNHSKLTNRDNDNEHPINAITGLQAALNSKVEINDIPTKVSQLENDSGYLNSTDKEAIVEEAKSAIDLTPYAEKTELNNYLPLSGGTSTGAIIAPNFQTGSSNDSYFQTKKMRGQGDANTYNHAVDWGYAGHNKVEFYEYGGEWDFYQCQSSNKNAAKLVGSIKSTGWNGGAVLTGTPTAPTAPEGTSTTQIATTEFVMKNKGEKGDKGDTGASGKDGISATHSWNGTVLTITSASGTSSADLKGAKGDKGADGKDGYTPVKGTDYWTATDKAEIVAEVLAQLPNGSEVSY